MRLTEIRETGGLRVYHFTRYRSDAVELDSLLITVDADSRLTQIEIRDNIEGNCSLDAHGNIIHCTSWESEEKAQESSSWSKHYTQRVGLAPGGRKEVLRIFDNLERSVADNYLRHILRAFPFGAGPVIFDADLYQVYVPPPPVAPMPAPPITEPERVKIPLRDRLRWVFPYLNSLSLSFVITVAVVTATFFYFLQRPRELGPKTLEMVQVESRDIFPVLKLIVIGPEGGFRIYEKSTPVNSEAFAENGEDIDFTNDQEFLDRLYPLPEQKQIHTFHDRVIQNNKLDDVRKARLLHRFFEDNLTKLIFHEGLADELYGYETLRAQLVYSGMVDYCFYLLRHNENKALAVESLMLLRRLVELQSRAIYNFFRNATVSSLCNRGNLEYLRNPNEAIVVCSVYSRYQQKIAEFTELDTLVIQLSIHLLEQASFQNKTGYRAADIQFEKALLEIAAAANVTALYNPVDALLHIRAGQAAGQPNLNESITAVQALLYQRAPYYRQLQLFWSRKLRCADPAGQPTDRVSPTPDELQLMSKFKSLEQDALLPIIAQRMKYLHERRSRLLALRDAALKPE